MSSINGISFGGLASGLDTEAIIRKLLAVERRPITLLEGRKATFKQQKSLFGDLESRLEKLQEAVNQLRRSNTFLEFAASTNDDKDHITASAGTGASAGSYKIKVESLAQARVAASGGSVDRDQQTHGSGFLVFTVDTQQHFVNIGANSTLDNIATAINDAGIPVSAQVVDTGDPTNPFRLVVTAKEAGTKGNFAVSTDTADLTLQNFAAALQADKTVEASDAVFRLNGLQITRPTNTFSDVIDGVTITLTGKHEAADSDFTTLTISPNTEATAEKIKDFVDAYNAVIDFIAEQQKFSPPEDTPRRDLDDRPQVQTNPLFGDSTISTTRFRLRSIVGASVDAVGNEAYRLLAQIGVEADRDGKLSFNQSEFEEALTDDEDAIRTLFTDATGGIATQIHKLVDDFTDPLDGILTARTKGIDRNIKDIDRQVARAEDRLDRYEEELTMRFANLELLMGRLNSQLGALSGLFGSS